MSSVAEILQQMAENAGRARLQSGALWGGTVANLGALPLQIRADQQHQQDRARFQAQQDAQALYAKNADTRATKDQAFQDVADARKTQEQALMNHAIGVGYVSRSDPKQPFNTDAASQDLIDAGAPHLTSAIHEYAASLQPKLTSGAPGSVMRNPDGSIVPNSAIPEKKSDYTNNGQRFSGDATPIGPVQPTQAAPKGYQHVDKMLDGKPTTLLIDPAPGGKIYDLSGQEVDNAAARVRPIPPASITIHNERERAGSNLPDWALNSARPTGADANKLDPTIKMTPNGLHQAAITFIDTGQFPPTGRGNDPIAITQRAAIVSKVGAIAADAGMDVPTLRATYKSNSASLTQLQKSADTVQAFLGTADKNSELLEQQFAKIPDTGSPLLNKPLRAIAKNAFGNVAMSEFGTLLQSVQNEYARILTQPNLAGQLTDSARHEAETLLNPNATVPQQMASLHALRAEGGNRLQSLGEQLQRTRGRMNNSSGGTTTPPTTPAADPLGLFGPKKP